MGSDSYFLYKVFKRDSVIAARKRHAVEGCQRLNAISVPDGAALILRAFP